jgi:DeoR family fructose operon transcriptional repressor
MYAEERRQHLVDLARTEGRLDVASVAADLDVTPETIRRDLTDLERRGLLRRVHGGAIPAERFRTEQAVTERAGRMTAEKRRIAARALDLVPERGTVLLDAGTTTGELAAGFPDRELTVVTNALPIATILADRPRLTVHVLGGRLRPRTLANVDGTALRALEDLRVDRAFVATNGVTGRGLSTHDHAEAQVKAAMIEAARDVVLLVDHTKLGDDQLVRYARLEQVDVLITDTGVDDDLVTELEAAGPKVVRA